jgi:hypothetical protein
MRLPARFLTRFGQGLEKTLPIRIVRENVLAPVPAARDMVNGAGIFDSGLTRHGPVHAPSCQFAQAEK